MISPRDTFLVLSPPILQNIAFRIYLVLNPYDFTWWIHCQDTKKGGQKDGGPLAP